MSELKENIKELINKIEQAKSFTKEQYNSLKKLFTKQNKELKVYYGELKEKLAAAKPGTPEYKEAEMKFGEAKKMMEMSENGLNTLKSFEGKVVDKNGLHQGYYCDAGKPTIGYGHVMNVVEEIIYKYGIDEEQATKLLEKDIHKFKLEVNNQITANLTQNQFDALVLLLYNIGPDSFKNSRTKDLINGTIKNNKKYKSLEEEYKEFNKIGEYVNKGLDNRRYKEWKIYKNNSYGNPKINNFYDYMKKHNRLINKGM